ncbi:hypothetical protein BpHYR1_038199 [Brachionus plicatilis]|uniref:Uncharacterized protein n=1 Tax=Brachionus plicatilis TaxID=10195 RepID=A0A3M7TA70_BRAPC|nr:hypothetical protein BpHYR1_038199 [Brachionus plicatilis]
MEEREATRWARLGFVLRTIGDADTHEDDEPATTPDVDEEDDTDEDMCLHLAECVFRRSRLVWLARSSSFRLVGWALAAWYESTVWLVDGELRPRMKLSGLKRVSNERLRCLASLNDCLMEKPLTCLTSLGSAARPLFMAVTDFELLKRGLSLKITQKSTTWSPWQKFQAK